MIDSWENYKLPIPDYVDTRTLPIQVLVNDKNINLDNVVKKLQDCGALYLNDLIMESSGLYSYMDVNFCLFVCLFGVLRSFQHCTGHITMGSWKGRGNQYIEFARVLYCKLPTNGKQLTAFPLQAMTGIEPRTQRWEASVTTLPPWPLYGC